jgi:hypothetical protein
MNPISRQTRIAGAFFAVVMSTVVLGATVLSMQAGGPTVNPQVVALERVVVSAPAVN